MPSISNLLRSSRRGLCALSMTLAALSLGCTPETDAAATTRPLVVVSAPPLGWFVEAIAGDAVDIRSLLPTGANPTLFEPGIAALRAIEYASLVVPVGHAHFPFEQAWFSDLLAERPDLPVVRVPAEFRESDDPHWWLSPTAARSFIGPLLAELIKILPEDSDTIRANAQLLRERIEALDVELAGQLRATEGRRFLVFHPAWGHFAQHFSLEQIAIENDGKPPDAHRLGLLIENARIAGFGHVIVQPQIDPAHAQSVATAIGARVVTLDPLARNWDSNLRAAARLLANGALIP